MVLSSIAPPGVVVLVLPRTVPLPLVEPGVV